MEYIFNKKFLILFAIFLILFPFGLYVLKIDSPGITKIADPAKNNTSPTQMTTIPEADPQKKMLDYVQNKKPLSASDAQAKVLILQSLEELPSGKVYQNSNITISYVKSADMFQTEITTIQIGEAKAETLLWFQDKGMSKEGICNLPLSFYLNFEVKDQMGETAEPFNPLPPGC